jgi:hypothetical protein
MLPKMMNFWWDNKKFQGQEHSNILDGLLMILMMVCKQWSSGESIEESKTSLGKN